MTSDAPGLDVVEGQAVQGASGRERALRFNRGVIGLCVVMLLGILILPV